VTAGGQGAADLVVRLDTKLPTTLPVGRGTAMFCFGACFHRRSDVRALALLVDGVAHRPTAWRMPRLDLFQLCPGEPRWYRSGFWATLPINARAQPGTVQLEVAARLDSGVELTAPLGRIEIVGAPGPPAHAKPSADRERGLIAICMTTFDPNPELFRVQVGSLREQTDTDWICLISDDCSQPERFEEIRETVAGDRRFVLSQPPARLGYYRNFERVLGLLPPEAELVALCDHDDRWYPEKLQVLRHALGTAGVAYSDQRLVAADGRVLRETLWSGRRNNHTNLASLLIANTITGAATLMRREVAELALPFPDTPGWQFHDHWIALVALASGEVAYVDRPLYDYVQHPGGILGQAASHGRAQSAQRLPYPEKLRRFFRGWRAAYFYGYRAREVQAQALLARCAATLSGPKRRVLRRFIAAERSPMAFTWLAIRALRGLTGATETMGTEAEFARGILWRHLIKRRTGRRSLPGGSPYDASVPPLDVDSLGENRLARWRAQL
jgi:glycosyltransferase involved in cell wall biosynthesis